VIVIDTSALIAMLQDEPERAEFASLIARAERRLVSTVSLLVAGMVARSRKVKPVLRCWTTSSRMPSWK